MYITDSIMVENPGYFTLVVTAINGCKDSLSTFVEFDTIKPNIVLEALGEIHCQSRTVTLIGTVDIPIDESNFLWTSPNGNFVSGQNTLSPSSINREITCYQLPIRIMAAMILWLSLLLKEPTH